MTNATLREAAGLDSSGARAALLGLAARGVLEQRGAKRGTHYVIRALSPEAQALAGGDTAPARAQPAATRALRRPLLDSLRRAVRRRGPEPPPERAASPGTPAAENAAGPARTDPEGPSVRGARQGPLTWPIAVETGPRITRRS